MAYVLSLISFLWLSLANDERKAADAVVRSKPLSALPSTAAQNDVNSVCSGVGMDAIIWSLA